jgi:hypothetical protein
MQPNATSIQDLIAAPPSTSSLQGRVSTIMMLVFGRIGHEGVLCELMVCEFVIERALSAQTLLPSVSFHRHQGAPLYPSH